MTNRLQAFQDFLTTQSIQIPVLGFIVNLLLAAALAYLLGRVYVKYGSSFSNRGLFARNFVLLATTTTLMISIIKHSLALSLGLVGALSIVRFRAAIKEPEELTYLFLNVAIGLGLGAGQRLITVVALAFIIGLIWLKNQGFYEEDRKNLFLTVSSQRKDRLSLDQMVAVLREKCQAVNLKRFDETPEHLEACFSVEFKDFPQLNDCKSALLSKDEKAVVTFLDQKGLF